MKKIPKERLKIYISLYQSACEHIREIENGILDSYPETKEISLSAEIDIRNSAAKLIKSQGIKLRDL